MSTLGSGKLRIFFKGTATEILLCSLCMTVYPGFFPSGIIPDKSTSDFNSSSFFVSYFISFFFLISSLDFLTLTFLTSYYSYSYPKSEFSSICFSYSAAIASSSLYTSGSFSFLISTFFGSGVSYVFIYWLPSAIAFVLNNIELIVS